MSHNVSLDIVGTGRLVGGAHATHWSGIAPSYHHKKKSVLRGQEKETRKISPQSKRERQDNMKKRKRQSRSPPQPSQKNKNEKKKKKGSMYVLPLFVVSRASWVLCKWSLSNCCWRPPLSPPPRPRGSYPTCTCPVPAAWLALQGSTVNHPQAPKYGTAAGE